MTKKSILSLEQVKEIEKTYPTPFHIYDEKAIRENARALKDAFSWNKGYREYFAVKATPNPFILKILQEEGCGVDCSSLTELMLSEALGFKNNDIMFSSNVTPLKEYQKASDLGAYINLDDYTHIDFLADGVGIPETIFCRYNPGGTFELGTDIMDNPGDSKYGFTKEQMIDGYKKLMKLGAKNFGIHAFLASNTVSNEYYPTLAGILFELAVEQKKPEQTSSISICPVVLESHTHQIKNQTTLRLSAKVFAKNSKRSLYQPVWAILRSSQNWVVSCLDLMVSW